MEPLKDETILARWLSGDLNPEELASLQAHPDFADWERIVREVDSWDRPRSSGTEEWEKQKALLVEKGESERPARRRVLYLVSALAAGILLTIVAYMLLQSDEILLESALAERQTYTLPAGSEVHLNAGSTVRYEPGDWSKARVLQLEGEAFFDVHKGVPFIVETSVGEVRVLGTQFNVLQRAKRFEVVCYEGTVRVSSGQRTQTLKAGEGVVLETAGFRRTDSQGKSEPGWKSGVVRFDNAPIAHVFEELERQFAIQVNFPSNLPGKYTGPMPLSNLEQALDIICGSMNLNYKVAGKEIRISEK